MLDRSWSGLPHSAALIGSGSETLGFDDEMSTDHNWGPRLQLFLRPDDWEGLAEEMDAALRRELPRSFLGYPTNFTEPDPDDGGTQGMEAGKGGQVNHLVDTTTISGFFRSYLGFDIDRPVCAADWLTFPQQKLRTITSGGIFHDGIGLDSVRARFGWYPPDLWRYLLAAGWARIGQEEHLMGRAGLVGDELGSALIGVAASAGPDVPVLSDGTTVCSVCQMVWYGIWPVGERNRFDGHIAGGAGGGRVAGAGPAAGRGIRSCSCAP